MRDHRKGEPGLHPGGIRPDRVIDKLAEIRERDNIIKCGIDVAASHSLHFTIKVNVFPTSCFLAKADAQGHDSGDFSSYINRTGGRCRNTGNQVQQCRLPGTIAANNSNALTVRNFEADAVHGGKCRSIMRMLLLEIWQGLMPRGGLD